MTDATPSNQALATALADAIEQATPRGGAWLKTQLASVTPNTLATAFSWVARKVGESPLDVSVAGMPVPEGGWSTAVCARLALLLRFAGLYPPAEQHRLLSDLFYRGDTAEKCAVLRCLPLQSEPGRYLLIATDSVRSHVQPVVEAIACENPFPARHFDDAAFNQLVMKAYFTGVPVRRIVGLQERKNGELSRMASDFADERRAAGRPVPPDLSLVTPASEP